MIFPEGIIAGLCADTLFEGYISCPKSRCFFCFWRSRGCGKAVVYLNYYLVLDYCCYQLKWLKLTPLIFAAL